MKTKMLVERMKRWRRSAVLGTKKIFISRSVGGLIADKGHFAVYAEDGKRFVVPVHCLGEPIFRELLKMAETKFEFEYNGAIIIPCNGDVIEFVLSKMRHGYTGENPLVEHLENSLCLSF